MAKNTVLTLAKQASEGKKVTMVTSYDYTMASIVEAAGINMILVGDSLGMTMLGYEDTIPVTMDDMVHHTRAVTRATSDTFVVGDMPFMSYQASVEKTRSASSTTRSPSRPRAPSPSCSSASRATSRSSSRASSPTASPSASAPAPRATARCSSRRTSSA